MRQTELTVARGCLMWGCRVVVPPNLRSRVLSELHAGHQGMVKMKQLGRMHVWWPNMDKQIEAEVRNCEGCWQKRAEPPSGDLHPWEYAKGPWQRIHLDFAGPVEGQFYVVVIDSYSKWMEIAPMKTITTEKTIEYLLNLFARWGLPHQLVTDNGPQLVIKDFEGFLERNGIKHSVTAPYKPSTNGAAERAVGCLKNLLKASKGKKVNIPNFLMAKRDGAIRFCVDMRRVCQAVITDGHPLPRMEDILDRLRGSLMFSRLDLKDAYQQLELHPES
ncbi:uncharacterized protein K02A2.6-like [Amphibalanus amphitrite]|uniref:uncharacterized protein K02A2.6-like n=1 Tax=Amphibalanus amphitrite TaxID=1232801 RepID=UPI001C906AF6|nr:uncharacterized protein K02A2.6-like [Amphibalanus amphitrite]